MDSIRSDINMLCPSSAPFPSDETKRIITTIIPYTNKNFHFVIFQRNWNRKFRDLSKVIDQLFSKKTRKYWSLTLVVHDDRMHPCVLQQVLSRADVLLTSHGFQNTGLLL